MNSNIKLKYSLNTVLIGLILIIIGIIMPSFLDVNSFKIYKLINMSLLEFDKEYLLTSATRLVILNTIRGVPYYLGVFIISESIDLYIKNKKDVIFKSMFIIIGVFFIYHIIYLLYDIKYDLGLPALTICFVIFIIKQVDYSKISYFKKSLIIILLLFGVQWLDIMPMLSFLKIGRGETSLDIKNAANILGAESVLNTYGSLMFFIFILNSMIVLKLINDENIMIVAIEKSRKIEKELVEAKIDSLNARYYLELKHLVHDLKTPLTSMQALVSLLMLKEEDYSKFEYLEKVNVSIDKMSDMISEILYKEKMDVITTKELFTYVLSNISALSLVNILTYRNLVEESYIKVNKVRITRAIVNALNNSYEAIIKEDGFIKLVVYKDSNDSNYINIEISDNGKGIKGFSLNELDIEGFSSKGSTGLGITFIQDVMRNHNGKLEINSNPGIGTKVILKLKEVHISGEKDSNNR